MTRQKLRKKPDYGNIFAVEMTASRGEAEEMPSSVFQQQAHPLRNDDAAGGGALEAVGKAAWRLAATAAAAGISPFGAKSSEAADAPRLSEAWARSESASPPGTRRKMERSSSVTFDQPGSPA